MNREVETAQMGHRVNLIYALVSFAEGLSSMLMMPFLMHALGDLASANRILSFMWVSMTIFEIPTGVWSDRLGAKNTLMLYLASKSLAAGLFSISATTPFAIYVGIVILGFGMTFLTGIFSLQLKSLAHAHGVSFDYPKLIAQGTKYKNLACILAFGIGTLGMKYLPLSSLWPCIIALGLLEALALYFFWENVSFRVQHKDYVRRGLTYIFSNREFLVLMSSNALFIMATMALVNNCMVLLVPGLEKTPYQLGFLGVAIYLLRAFGAWTYSRFPRKVSPIVIGALLSFMLVFIFLDWRLINLVGVPLAIALLTLLEIDVRSRILEIIPGELSSTILSLQSMGDNILGSLALYGLSMALARVSLPILLSACAAPVMVGTGLLSYLKPKATNAPGI